VNQTSPKVSVAQLPLLTTTMANVRYQALIATTAILLFGTLYSVLYSTYLDTSDPLLTHLGHPLSSSHYFASKSNPLNVLFIKRAWGWTSAAFLFTYLTSPPAARTKRRIVKYLICTTIWLLFTGWFFGPALLERVIVFSGGECVATLPSGEHFTIPNELCYAKTTLTPKTHPDLFAIVSTFDAIPEVQETWRIKPRLRKGHDISGHIFLLTMSILFLADQLRPSFSNRASNVWSQSHMWAVAAQISLIAIWLFATYTTAVYFHSPFEKITGYCTFLFLLPMFFYLTDHWLISSTGGREFRRLPDSITPMILNTRIYSTTP